MTAEPSVRHGQAWRNAADGSAGSDSRRRQISEPQDLTSKRSCRCGAWADSVGSGVMVAFHPGNNHMSSTSKRCPRGELLFRA